MTLPRILKRNPSLIFAILALILFLLLVFLRSTGVLSALSRTETVSNKTVESINQASGQWEIPKKQAFFKKESLFVPNTAPTVAERIQSVLSSQTGADRKWIEIDLGSQKLRAWEDNNLIYEFIVSTGTKWTPTPVGEFRIWIKLRYHTMEGGSKIYGNYYYLPNVPFVMYFHKGYGIHGTYWHNNFGTPMSHGCVNLSNPDAEKLFWWAQPTYQPNSWATRPTEDDLGTRVVVHK